MSDTELNIGDKKISTNDSKVFVIAEIGNNHNGSFELAKKLIDCAVEAGADCAKFQMRNLSKVYRDKSIEQSGDDLSVEYTIDLLKKFELTHEEQRSIKAYCESRGILYLCTPWDESSLEELEKMEVQAYKVSSADLTNWPLLVKIKETNKPMILSSGMATESEIKKTVNFLAQRDANFCMLHCNSTYPAPFHSINLNYLSSLKKIHPLIGYSGHERGISISLGAVALGAKVVERHLTLDRNMEGPDHAASLEPDQFKSLVTGIRELEEALGEGGVKKVSQGEMINRENLAKSIVSSRALKKGDIIKLEDLKVRSPGQGLSPLSIDELIGTELTRDMDTEDYFYKSDLGQSEITSREYSFSRPWGIPVRYHDYKQFSSLANYSIVEFHLSYSDMELDLSDFLSGTYDIGYVVHAPELFKGSHLLDLATPDDEYRKNSIYEMQRTINITRDLNKYFPKTKKPMIVTNIGGFSRDSNISDALKSEYYERFLESMEELDTEGIEVIPQTMAPFPWHFGGQRYQNLFVLPDEIVSMCEKSGLRMCLDVSHSKLTCNHFGISFKDFCEKVGPYTAHLHLGDASGVDGEGLQVGEGEIDFKELGAILNRTCPDASFIPEIWQGHKNQGEGFWTALEKLESVL